MTILDPGQVTIHLCRMVCSVKSTCPAWERYPSMLLVVLMLYVLLHCRCGLTKEQKQFESTDARCAEGEVRECALACTCTVLTPNRRIRKESVFHQYSICSS